MSCLKKENNRTILAVDDEAEILQFLKDNLVPLSWDVVTVLSPDEAFVYLESHPVFCILTDLAMPIMDGYEFISEIRKRGFPSQIILMTGFGYNPDHTLIKINSENKYPCIFKPFNRKKLAETIQTAYETYHKEL